MVCGSLNQRHYHWSASTAAVLLSSAFRVFFIAPKTPRPTAVGGGLAHRVCQGRCGVFVLFLSLTRDSLRQAFGEPARPISSMLPLLKFIVAISGFAPSLCNGRQLTHKLDYVDFSSLYHERTSVPLGKYTQPIQKQCMYDVVCMIPRTPPPHSPRPS